MDDLYRDFILEHYKRPRNFGELDSPDREAHEATIALLERDARWEELIAALERSASAPDAGDAAHEMPPVCPRSRSNSVVIRKALRVKNKSTPDAPELATAAHSDGSGKCKPR